ncbi:peptidase M15 [Kribbella sandramycini]|uniref:LAS superfamily LD-carboxypeptidase LdcB n=1 Tax=Kribbella sandramycini TaxID=60450 RepID=A0A7Y4L268_9ACTN|nr:M15 family metallopeptidase [Kribbella sandramycini]MBB6566351.1 LAS superfamily LD-carboxypeptidase LdcB [Kribbella sandramycini]NOL42988.1 peptidase M15 [Kribbella sandramycini]
MTNDLPPRPRHAVRKRSLSVTAVAVLVTLVGSLLIWHTQLGELFKPAADKEPVVSGLSAPPVSGPPSATLRSKSSPSAPKPKPTLPKATVSPAPKKVTRKPKPVPKPVPKKTAEYDEESLAGLAPKLRTRLKKAILTARADGVTIRINSGRRSAAKQQRLFDAAVKKYGSRKAAARWVLPPEDSAHVHGKAVDIAPAAAMAWLDKNGYRFGICRRYDNEPWHFEAITSPGRACPPREPHSVAKSR